MPGLAPEVLDALCSASAAAWPVLGLVAGLLIVGLRYECSRRAAVEQELQESESRYRAIFETAVDAIIVTDQHGIIQEFSKTAERMTGYLAAEVIGQNMRVLLPANLRQEHDRYTAALLVDSAGIRGLSKGWNSVPGSLIHCRMVGRRISPFHRDPAGSHQPEARATRTSQARSAALSSRKDGGHRQSNGRYGAGFQQYSGCHHRQCRPASRPQKGGCRH